MPSQSNLNPRTNQSISWWWNLYISMEGQLRTQEDDVSWLFSAMLKNVLSKPPCLTPSVPMFVERKDWIQWTRVSLTAGASYLQCSLHLPVHKACRTYRFPPFSVPCRVQAFWIRFANWSDPTELSLVWILTCQLDCNHNCCDEGCIRDFQAPV